ncbi:DUF2975 domain-containing protein [Pedobacter sp. SYP-B3415]|uniref:DUF2975 domain-containing protein n=1 Tax=Pedobacter sp. SYP-B3415 TaxID=2496641 RepID=UPI00101D7F11|nr:DUF2975 domain-containing protein [Pedobacter sp. SYP-B3415]
MNKTQSILLRVLYALSNFAVVVYVIAFVVNVLTSASPATSKAIKSFQLEDINVTRRQHQELTPSQTLEGWFKNNVIVHEYKRGTVHLRFRSWNELMSFPAVSFQLGWLLYWLIIGLVVLGVRQLLAALRKNMIFTRRNILWLQVIGFSLIALPLSGWLMKELFIHCISEMGMNDSGYLLHNASRFTSSETIWGSILLVIAFVFRTGAQLKEENESFV